MSEQWQAAFNRLREYALEYLRRNPTLVEGDPGEVVLVVADGGPFATLLVAAEVSKGQSEVPIEDIYEKCRNDPVLGKATVAVPLPLDAVLAFLRKGIGEEKIAEALEQAAARRSGRLLTLLATDEGHLVSILWPRPSEPSSN